MGNTGSPLSAPAAWLLLELPAAAGEPRPLSTDNAPVKLALQELLARRALTLEVVRDGVMLTEATLGPGTDPGDLPPALDQLHATLRPLVPDTLKKVLTKAHRRNPVMTTDVRSGARRELVDRELIEERSVRRLGRRRTTGWARTGAGDALTSACAQQLERLREREDEVDKDSVGAIAALFAADHAAAPVWEEIELEGGNRGGYFDMDGGGGGDGGGGD